MKARGNGMTGFRQHYEDFRQHNEVAGQRNEEIGNVMKVGIGVQGLLRRHRADSEQHTLV